MNIEVLELQNGTIPGFITNCYLVSAAADAIELVVIDPADQIEQILTAVGKRKVAAIVLTHRHDDHTSACAQLVAATQAPVYAHKLDAKAIQEPTGRYPGFATDHRLPPVVTEFLSDNQTISLARINFEVLHTPGHSIGSICLYAADDAALFSGDTLFYGTTGRTDLPTGDAAAMHRSLKRLAQLPDQVRVYPGHELSTTIGAERYRALVEY